MIRLNQYPFKEEYTYYMLQALKAGKKGAFRKDFLDLHPTDQAAIFIELDSSRRRRVYPFLSPAEFVKIFSRLALAMQKRCLLELDRRYVIDMLNELPSADAAYFSGLHTHQEADFAPV